MWYYTSYYNVLNGDYDSYYADYYNSYSDDDGYYSEIYASPDWSEYYGSSVWDTDIGYTSYYFNSLTNTEESYYETKDGLYNSYYDAVLDNFSEYVYTAPVDQYYVFVSDDGMYYEYSFVDGDGCYSYSGQIYNTEYDGKVYINENGHQTVYYSIDNGCWNTYEDLTYGEYSEYWDHIDEYDVQGNYVAYYTYDACYDVYHFESYDYDEFDGAYSYVIATEEECSQAYVVYFGVNGETCDELFYNSCNGNYAFEDNSFYDEDTIENEDGTEYYYVFF